MSEREGTAMLAAFELSNHDIGPTLGKESSSTDAFSNLPDKQEMISKQPAIVNQELISLTRSVGKQTSLTLAHLSICNCSVLPTYCVKRS